MNKLIKVKQLDGTTMVLTIGASYLQLPTGKVLRLIKIERHRTETCGLFVDDEGVHQWRDVSWNFHRDYLTV